MLGSSGAAQIAHDVRVLLGKRHGEAGGSLDRDSKERVRRGDHRDAERRTTNEFQRIFETVN